MGKRKTETKPAYVQTRWTVDLRSGEISDPGAEGVVLYSWVVSSFPGSQYEKRFTTRNALLARAISDDIKQEQARELRANIAASTAKLNALVGPE